MAIYVGLVAVVVIIVIFLIAIALGLWPGAMSPSDRRPGRSARCPLPVR